MKIKSFEIIRELKDITDDISSFVLSLEKLPEGELLWRPDATSWNILECLEHLNRYAEFYHPIIRTSIEKFEGNPSYDFRPGWLGHKAVKDMLPKKGMKKMNTFSKMDPLKSDSDNSDEMKRFLIHQNELGILLEKSLATDLNKIRIPTMLGNWIRFKLGDIFRFLVYHNERHRRQIENSILKVRNYQNGDL